MKKIIRLILIGIVAGATYKLLSDKDIKVSGVFARAKELAASAMEQVERTAEADRISGNGPADNPEDGASGNTSGRTALFSSGMPDYEVNISSGEALKPASEGEDAADIDMSVTDADDLNAVEFAIETKPYYSPGRFAELDRYASQSDSQAESSLQSLAEWLMREASDEAEKARLIFTWIATHVSYDDNGFNTGNYAGTSPEEVFRNRVSVCQGYSELFTALCRLAGLEAETITGYAKGISYRPGSRFSETNHAWNTARIDGRWRLFDVTWAAGYGKGVNGRLVTVMDFNDYWFDVNPMEAVFSHLPADDAWQLMDQKITKYQFENLPYVSGLFFKMGFNGSQILPLVMNGNISSFPKAYLTNSDIKIISMPCSGILPSGVPVKMKVRAEEGVRVAYYCDGRIVPMNSEGGEYVAVARPAPGEFAIMTSRGGPEYETVLEYEVR